MNQDETSQKLIPPWKHWANLLRGIYNKLSKSVKNENNQALLDLKHELLSILNNNLINDVIAVTTKKEIQGLPYLQYFAFCLSCVFAKLQEIDTPRNRGFNNLNNLQIYDFIKNLQEKDICVFFDLALNGIDGNVAVYSLQNDDLQKFDDFYIFFINEPTYIQGTFIQQYFTWANDNQKKIIANFISSNIFLKEKIENKTQQNVYNILVENNVSNIRNVFGEEFLENALKPFLSLTSWINKVQEALQNASEDAGENTITLENLQILWNESIADDDLALWRITSPPVQYYLDTWYTHKPWRLSTITTFTKPRGSAKIQPI